MLGRDVAVISVDLWEFWCTDICEDVPQHRMLKLWVDLERGFILKQELYGDGSLSGSVTVTELSYDLAIADDVFAFTLPAGARPSGEKDVGACRSRLGPEGCPATAPEGFLFPAYVPEGFVVDWTQAHDYTNDSVQFFVRLLRPSLLPKSTHLVDIRQLRRPGGFPDASLDGEPVRLTSGRQAYQSFYEYKNRLIWLDGDLIVVISTSLPPEDLLLIASSMH